MSSKPSGTAAMFSTNRNLEITNLFALVAGGIIIKIIFYSQGPANSTIWGYSLSAIAVFLLMIISISFSYNSKLRAQENIFDLLIKFGLPSMLFLLLLVWAIGQTISFFDKINSQVLPEEFNMYSFISSFLIIVQAINLYMFFNEEYSIQYQGNKSQKKKQDEAEIENMDNTSIMYILTIINTVILGMMQIVLTFFTTDG